MKKCYVCDRQLTIETESDEHIIINAAGGRLKSKELICDKCNPAFSQMDQKLAKQLNHLANMFMVSRHRGDPPAIESIRPSTGEKYLVEPGGKPKLAKASVKKIVDGENVNISVKARNEEELRNHLKGIAKDFPQLDIEAAMKAAVRQKEYIDEPLQHETSIGGTEVFRAICKCATNFFIYKNGDVAEIKHLIPYITGKAELNVVWLHYRDGLYELGEEECSHVIHLVGDSAEGVLYCYVDYFNVYKFIVMLSDAYAGIDMSETYCFDLIDVKPVSKKVSLKYDRGALTAMFRDKDSNPHERVKKAFERALALALKLQDSLERKRLIDLAIQNSLGKYPEGENITKAMREEVIKEITDTLMPYLSRRLKK
jgi:hypothetical protein